jgi:hypothetical protein
MNDNVKNDCVILMDKINILLQGNPCIVCASSLLALFIIVCEKSKLNNQEILDWVKDTLKAGSCLN